MQLSTPHLQDHDHRALLEAYLKELNLPMFLEHYQAYAKMPCVRGNLRSASCWLYVRQKPVAERPNVLSEPLRQPNSLSSKSSQAMILRRSRVSKKRAC